jgi:hypothetical protein
VSATPTPETGLTPELIDRVRKLSPQDKDKLLGLLEDELFPPDPRTDEEIAAMIKQRSDEVASGNYTAMTPEEVERNIRESLRRRYGFEL